MYGSRSTSKAAPAPLLPGRYDMSRTQNQAKLDAVDELALLAEDAGLTLIHLALAFTLVHPVVTAPIIGPRTMEQLESQLGAVDVTLSEDILDRIDKIVPPGATINRESDSGYLALALREPSLRRRRTA